MEKHAFLAAAVFLLAISSCSQVAQDDSRIDVVVTTYPLYEFASRVGGEHVRVTNLLPSGMDPHSFEPRPSDMAKVSDADILIYNGGGFEPWIGRMLDSVGSDSLKVIDSVSGIDLLRGEHEEGEEGDDAIYDPHVWLDPRLAKEQVTIIRDALIDSDPDNSQAYGDNAKAYLERLDALDGRYEEVLSTCRKDVFVSTGHSAFGYLARRFNLTSFALKGVSHNADVSARDMEEMLNLLSEHNLSAIYYEEYFDPKTAKIISEDQGISALKLNDAAFIQAGAGDYFSVMEENLKNLAIGLECDMP